MALPPIPFYFVRHGETEANVSKQVAGWFDSPLTENGRQQAKHLSSIMGRLPQKPTKIFHSDLSRAKDTALAVNNVLKLDMIEHKGLREHHFGDHEGKSCWDDVFNILESQGIPQNGESYDMFYERALSVFSEIITEKTSPILITAHGGFAHQIKRLLGRDYTYSSDNIVRNCHLHYFEPWPENLNAPWKVHVFDEIDGEVVQSSASWCPSTAR
ncbi:MAG: histidine phosphatase family protein [Bdellovibrionales bacterium]